MMCKRTYILITAAVFLFTWTGGDVCPQSVIIRVSPDGSLVIQDRSAGHSQRPLIQNQEVALLGSQAKVEIIRGCTENLTGPPIVTRGRAQPKRWLTSSRPPSPPSPLPHSSAIENAPLTALIEKTASEYGVDPGLVRLVVQKESGYNPQAVSPKGAMGLMQLMPGTAAMLGVQDPFNPEQNISGGVKYLKHCMERFNNNVCLALAAYNAGPENVARYQGVPPFAETRNYVSNIMQEYTGQPVELPGPPSASPPQNHAAGRSLPKKTAFSNTDLQPLFLPGGGRVNIVQSGKAKIFEIIGN